MTHFLYDYTAVSLIYFYQETLTFCPEHSVRFTSIL